MSSELLRKYADILEGKNPGISKNKETEFHSKLDNLVHDTFGKRKEEEQIDEVSAPGQEEWIRKNKQRFIDQYGKDKGLSVLYATAWKRAKK